MFQWEEGKRQKHGHRINRVFINYKVLLQYGNKPLVFFNASKNTKHKVERNSFRQKQWLATISDAFGGMEILGIDILVAKDGREIIHDVNDAVTLLGDTQEDDRRTIADLVQTHIIQL